MAAPAPVGPRIFVSYNRQDAAICRRLVEALERRGVSVWVDWTGATEGDFIKRINQGLEKCDWLTLLETPHSLASDAVEMEVNAAQNRVLYGQMRGVMRLVAAPRDPRAVPPTWATLQFYDATTDFEAAVEAMLVAVRARDAQQARRPGAEHPGAPAVPPPVASDTPANRLIARMSGASEAGDWYLACDNADLLLDRYPGETTTIFYRLWGRALLELGKPQDAAKALLEAWSRDKEDIPTTRAAARALLRENDYAQAEPLLKAALTTDDPVERLDVLREYVPTLEALGRNSDALLRVEQALSKLAPNDPSWLIAKRDLLVKLGHQAEALAVARQLAARPDATADDALALTRLARATGDLDAAYAAFTEAEKRAPDASELAAERAPLLAALSAWRAAQRQADHPEVALTTLEREMRLAPRDNDTQRALLVERAELLPRAGRDHDARTVVTNLLAPGAPPLRDPALALRLARLCVLLGMATQGWEALERAGLLAPSALGGAGGAETLAAARALFTAPGGAMPGPAVTLARGLVAAGQPKEAWALLAAPGVASDPRVSAARAELFPPPSVPQRLAQLGFRGVNSGAGQAITPPLIPVPAGPFEMGEGSARHRVEVAAFQIGKYPVTVAEYALAVAARAVSEPSSWSNLTSHPDHPVVYVSWQDAMAYIAWLRGVTGQEGWRLPSEAMWEKAARWDAARGVSRTYPWGDTFDKNRANTSESGINATSPVGSYPSGDARRSGASPYGVEEMAGNVWEWTSTLYRSYPYYENDGREDLHSTENRTLRGGSWGDDASGACAACRDVSGSDYLHVDWGFRLALALGDDPSVTRGSAGG